MRTYSAICTESAGRSGQRGVVLVLFALFAFSFFAILSWVVDLGFARLSHVQMDTATSSAALEGLRLRDDPMLFSAAERDAQRRAQASLMAGFQFDDDFYAGDSTPFDDPFHFGAGPAPILDDGFMGKVHAGRLIQINHSTVYKPRSSAWTLHNPLALEINDLNAPYGDLVAGTMADFHARIPLEAKDYSRNDFLPTNGVDASATANAFLVRMRRSTDVLGLDRIPGVSSSGPTIPFLFGMGTSIQKENGSSYNPRIDGITVRATSIAQGRPVMMAGPRKPLFSIPGYTPFYLFDSVWNDPNLLEVEESTGVEINNVTGEIRSSGGGVLLGNFFQDQAKTLYLADALLPSSPPVPDEGRGFKWAVYVPLSFIIETEGSFVPRVVGFGAVQLTLSDTSANPWIGVLERLPSRIAKANTSATLSGNPFTKTPDSFLVVMDHYRALVDPLLAPALAR